MANEVTLQELIETVKTDLFTPVRGKALEGKSVYPIFFVDQVELEIQVDFSYEDNMGLVISIPQIVEGSVSHEAIRTNGHTIKIILKPILTAEELRTRIKEDKRLIDGIEEASLLALRKGSKLSGFEE